MKSQKADIVEQKAFVENFQQIMSFLFIVSQVTKIKVKILFTDEASLRRDGTIHWGWYKKGVPPEIPETNGRFESVKLIGAVDQQNGSFHLKKACGKITAEVYLDF